MQKVHWGLLSTANINRRLIPAIRASAHGELTAVASRDLATAKSYASAWVIPHAFGNYQEMLDSDLIDAVYIGLPNHLHAEWSIRALQSGKHVLCEKPMAISIEEIEAMIVTSRQNQRVLAEAFMYRHHPQTRITQEWISSGRIGDVILIQGTFNFKLNRRQNYRLVSDYGGGCLWDVGVYPLSYSQMIFGDPPQFVSAAQWVGETGVDETFAGILHYSQDRIAHISSSLRSPFFTQVEIIGTDGRISLNRPFSAMEDNRRLLFYPNEADSIEIPVPEQELYIGEVEDMHNAILKDSPTLISLQETRDHIRTVLALYEAAKTRQVIAL